MQSVKRRLVLSLALVLGGCGPSEGRQKPARRQELIPAPEPPSDAVPRTELQRAEKSVLCNGSHAEHRLGVGWGFEAWEKLAVPFEHRHRVHSNLTRFDAPIDGVKSSADQPEVLGQDRPFDRRVVAFFLAVSFAFILVLCAQCAVPCFDERQGPVYLKDEPTQSGDHAMRLPFMASQQSQQHGEVMAFACRVVHFCSCATAVIASGCLLDFLQERTMDKFEDPAALELCKRFAATVITFVVLRFVPREDICGVAPLPPYSVAAYTRLLSSMARGLAPNLASFPLLVLAESCKMPTVMMLGYIVPGKSYRSFEYASALLVLLGVFFVLFYDGDSAEEATSPVASSFRGVLLLLVYVVSDAFTSNWQASMFEQYALRVGPMMLWLSFFGFALSLVGFIASTLSFHDTAGMLSNAGVGWDVTATSIVFTIAQFLSLVLIQRYGAVALAGVMSARQVAPILFVTVFSSHVLNSLQVLGAMLVFLALAAHLRFSWYADAEASYAMYDVKNPDKRKESSEKAWPTAEQALSNGLLLNCTCCQNKCGTWWRDTVVGSDWGLPAFSAVLLVIVTAGTTLVTRTALNVVIEMPVAFAGIMSTVTVIWLLPILVIYPASSALHASMIPTLFVATLLCFLDVAATAIALPLLTPPLRQLMPAILPSITLMLETCFHCKAKHPVLYVAVLMLTLGSAVVFYGAFGTPIQQQELPAAEQPIGEQPAAWQAEQPAAWQAEPAVAAEQPWLHQLLQRLLAAQQVPGTITPAMKNDPNWVWDVQIGAMGLAILATSVKYCVLRGIRHSHPEVGSLSLLFWCQIFMPIFVVPWSIAYGELGEFADPAGLHIGFGMHTSRLWLIAAAVLSGVLFLVQLFVLRYMSATSLAVLGVAGHLLAAGISVATFNPFLNTIFSPTAWDRMVLASEIIIPCSFVLYLCVALNGSFSGCWARTQASVGRGVGSDNIDTRGPDPAADDPVNDKPVVPAQLGDWTLLPLSDSPPHFRTTSAHRRNEAAAALFGADERLGADVLPVLVCGYNEEVGEFTHTLGSLASQQLELHEQGWGLMVVIGLDGWSATSASMQQFCEHLFPATTCGSWREELETSEDCLGVALRRTVPLSREGGAKCVQLDLTLYIKRENRKKDDTIAMFLCGCVPHALPQSDVVFLTDCGSAFEQSCLWILVLHMLEHPLCAGATGRPRVAHSCPWDTAAFSTWEGKWCRGAQTAEHEMDAVIRYDFTSKIGFMPVLPGPCNIWRLSLISEKGGSEGPEAGSSAVTNFDEIIAESKLSTQPLKANIRLAEDRLLTLAALAFSTRHANVQLNWVPGAIFYYQAEPTFEALFSQRRRWNNGTLACHMEVLTNIGRYTRSRSTRFTACLWLYAFMESLAAICGVFAPGITFGVVVVAIKDSSELWTPVQPFVGFLLGHQVFLAFYASMCVAPLPPHTRVVPILGTCPPHSPRRYLGFLAWFILAHRRAGKPLPQMLMFVACGNVILTAFVTLIRIAWLVYVSLSGQHVLTGGSNGSLLVMAWGSWLTLMVCYTILCVRNRDLASLYNFARHFVLYSMLWVTLRGWFMAAHTSMLHVLSWGNRPDRDSIEGDMRRKSLGWVLVVLLLNGLAVFGVVMLGVGFEVTLAIVTFISSFPTLIIPLLGVCMPHPDAKARRAKARALSAQKESTC